MKNRINSHIAFTYQLETNEYSSNQMLEEREGEETETSG